MERWLPVLFGLYLAGSVVLAFIKKYRSESPVPENYEKTFEVPASQPSPKPEPVSVHQKLTMGDVQDPSEEPEWKTPASTKGDFPTARSTNAWTVRSVRRALVLSELLDRPRALRPYRFPRGGRF